MQVSSCYTNCMYGIADKKQATHFLLGTSVDSLQNPQTVFADAFGNAQRVQSLIARVG
jgi:hypothetical protein